MPKRQMHQKHQKPRISQRCVSAKKVRNIRTAAPPTALKMVEVPTALVIVLPSVVKVEKRVSVETGVLEVPPVPVAEPALAPALVAEGFRLVTPDAEPAGPVAVPAAVRAEVAERVPTLD